MRPPIQIPIRPVPANPGNRRLLFLGLAWTAALMFIGLVGADSWPAGITDDLLYLLLLLILGRMLLRPQPGPDVPEKIYELHGALTITFVSSLGILLFSSALLPGLFPAEGGDFPAKPGTLLLLIAAIKSLGLLQRGMSLEGRPARFARWAVAAGVGITVLGTLSPTWDSFLFGATVVLSLCLAPIVFFRALRSDWVVRLRREGKYRLAGLSFLLILAAIGWHIVLREMIAPESVYGTSLDLAAEVLAEMVALVAFSWGSGLLMRTLATLPTATIMDRRQNEVASLSNLGMMMLDEFDRDRLIVNAISTAAEVTGSEFVWIRLFEPGDEGQEEVLTGSRGEIDPGLIERFHALRIPDGGGTIGEIGLTADSIALFNVSLPLPSPGKEEKEEATALINGMIAVVPVTGETGARGALYLFTREDRGYDRDDRLMLETVAAQISLTVKHADLVQRSIERERLESEMQIAREAQLRLLPARLPSLDGAELWALSLPASMVGGDYYDTIEFRDGSIGCIVADVSGKGAGAALYMGMVKGVARGLSGDVDDPVEFLIRINNALHRNIDPRFFVTMSIARIVPGGEAIDLARAGHTPGLLVRRNLDGIADTLQVVPGGIGLALTGEETFRRSLRPERLRLEPGDVLALYSDGLSEARNEQNDELGQERFAQLLTDAVSAGAENDLESVADGVIRRISAFSEGAGQHDDITLLLIRRPVPLPSGDTGLDGTPQHEQGGVPTIEETDHLSRHNRNREDDE